MWAPLHLTRTKLAAGLVRILMVGTKRKRGVDSSAGAATAPVTIAYELPEVPTPEPASAAGTPKKKKTQKEPLPKRDPPSDWEKVWQIIEGYRGDHPAAVDTMGCERLADTDAGDKAFRFQSLVALMLSSQTKDPITAQAMQNIKEYCQKEGIPFDAAAVDAMTDSTFDGLISKVGFHNNKTKFIKQAARQMLESHEGDVPADLDTLLALKGVGPKMAHLFLQCAYNVSHGIGVDTHVHRISRRLGWTKTKESDGPERTRLELESWVPKDKWAAINPLLVGFGQTICAPINPGCAECPVNEAGLCPTGRKVKVVKKVAA